MAKQEAKKEQQQGTQTEQPQTQQPAKEADATTQQNQPDKSKYLIDPDKVD